MIHKISNELTADFAVWEDLQGTNLNPDRHSYFR